MARSVKLDSRYDFIAITDQRQNERQTELFCRSGERRLWAECVDANAELKVSFEFKTGSREFAFIGPALNAGSVSNYLQTRHNINFPSDLIGSKFHRVISQMRIARCCLWLGMAKQFPNHRKGHSACHGD